MKIIVAIALVLFFSNPASASEITSERVIQLTNQERTLQGFPTLQESAVLKRVAQDKLDDMIKNNYFAHTSPEGKSPWSWFMKEDYDYQYAGENLAINFYSAEDQMKAWMDSENHRKNILNPVFEQIGVATGVGTIEGKTSIITVQSFGTLAKAGLVKNEFSSQKDSDVKDKLRNQKPIVLSGKKDGGAGKGTNWNSEYLEVFFLSLVLALLILSLAGIVLTLLFLEKVFSKIREKRLREDGVVIVSPEEYLRVLFSLDKTDLRGMKVIKIESG